MSPIEIILARIRIDPETGCWLWPGAKDGGGYGYLTLRIDGARRNRKTHRLMWEFYNGPIPEGLELDHVRARGCLYRHCCCPDHLEPVTHSENVLRGLAPEILKARHAARTHCKHGHEYTPENSILSHGRRHCRTCKNEQNRLYMRSYYKPKGDPPVTHCKWGHPFDEENTGYSMVGERQRRRCRTCARERARARRAA